MPQIVTIIRTWSKIHKVIVIIRSKAIISIRWWYRHSHTYAYNLQSYCTSKDLFCVVRSNRVFGYFLQVLCLMRDLENLTLPLRFVNPWGILRCKKTVICILKKMVQALETCRSFKTIFVGNCKNSIWYQMFSFVYSCLANCFMSKDIETQISKES